MGQRTVPEFFITVAPSVVTVLQGEATSVTLTITCDTSSLVVAADCNTWKFDFHFSEFPEGMHAETADGRVGANTILISASSKTTPGSFPIQVNVGAGKTAQVQTFVLNVGEAAGASSFQQGTRPRVDVEAGPALAREHHVLVPKTPEEFDRKANDLGRNSWELVSVVPRQY